MAKFDYNKIIANVGKVHGSDVAAGIGVGDDLPDLKPEDFITMPQWWQDATGSYGIPFSRYIMIAGDSDSGKTSAAIEAMKAAQQQGCAIVYIETEGKTTTTDLSDAGVDTSQLAIIQETVAEKIYKKLFAWWDEFRKEYPNEPILIVFDSIGNVISLRDIELDLEDQSSKPGGKGQTNRIGMTRVIHKIKQEKTAVFLLNYTYDNIGSVGKTNAGGKALNFYSSLTYQTTRKKWVEKVVKGEKLKAGVEVSWTLFKNHLARSKSVPKKVTLKISENGIEYLGAD